jgi:hypothetical protein
MSRIGVSTKEDVSRARLLWLLNFSRPLPIPLRDAQDHLVTHFIHNVHVEIVGTSLDISVSVWNVACVCRGIATAVGDPRKRVNYLALRNSASVRHRLGGFLRWSEHDMQDGA